jgi:tetratricopeptide (TPR) repeat protein
MYERAQIANPLSPVFGAGIAWVHMTFGRYAEAHAQINRSLALDSTFLLAHLVEARAHLYEGNTADALAGFERIVASDSSSINIAFLGNAYAVAGRHDDARRGLLTLLERNRAAFVPALAFAMIHIGLGDHDRAFQYLDRATRERDPWLTENNYDRVFDPLRGDARFVSVLKQLGLENYPAARITARAR